ncbi:MAG: class I SAM-dependent methyltransferase [Gammaproteobacteria bacterium]|nr:class I SAM-dependent methyltransferase [Gammaproteobacteria bacterium]MBI5619247.1 class I SAM-dependent methyltransferase [Gammaproteobacteria bacterium]
MTREAHWQNVYTTKAPDAVSWFQPRAALSLRFIAEAGLPPAAPIIDVGAGASRLVDGLLALGHQDLTLLDVSDAALAVTRARLGPQAAGVTFLSGDATTVPLPAARYALWHDRAVFHFLTEAAERAAYLAQLRRALTADGQVVIATFAEDGPEKCSGLPVRRYRATELAAELGADFELCAHDREQHATPFGTTQSFTYCRFRRRA